MWGGAKRKTLREFYDTVIGKGTMETADLITCVSKHERDMLIEEIGVSEENIKIIYNGINWSDWKVLPDKKIFRAQYPEISEKFVLFAGRLATNKGISDLISAMKEVNQKSIDLVVVGADMGLAKSLEKEAFEKGVKMHRLGHIDDNTYRSVLASAEMLVLPSEYEAFGIVLLEAAAAETAVIGTNVGGIPEAMSPGENGLIVEYNDVTNLAKSIAKLLEDEKMCKEMGSAGRTWAQKFSWDSIVKDLESEYRSIIG
jgi:phosphatidylinositol alpha-1,6-mannosyltransferase